MSKVQFKERATTEALFVHCSATRPEQAVGVREIRQWHKEQGWLDIGYHFVIKRSGEIEEGRPMMAVGSHVKDHNHNSIGVCLVGGINVNGQPEANFTPQQMESLRVVLGNLKDQFPEASIRAHHDVAAKACPSFHVKRWLNTGELVTWFQKEE